MSYRDGSSGSGGSSNSEGFGKKPNKGTSNQRSFAMNAVPPPSSLMGRLNVFQKPNDQAVGLSKHGYSTMNSISQLANSSQYAIGKKKSRTEDEYFEDDEETALNMAYIPAPGSPSFEKKKVYIKCIFKINKKKFPIICFSQISTIVIIVKILRVLVMTMMVKRIH